jgi:hypothetical protein
MTPRDENVFLKAADEFQAWILVRQTNPKSLQYLRKTIYQSKPISCKPKTADLPLSRSDKKIDGLVADPNRWPAAFSKLSDARQFWSEFRLEHGLGEFKETINGFIFSGPRSSALGFAINTEPTSTHEGCLTLEGKYLYGDFDLFDIVFLKKPGVAAVEVVPTGPRFAKKFNIDDHRDEQWQKIANFINLQLGVPMIQHGSQFLYKPKEFQQVDAFGPNRTQEEWSAAEVQRKYQQWGRI